MMLRFRKMMAVLLAAALTLTMLTACGGGGSGASVDAKVKLTNDINSFLTGSYPKVEYDKALDEYAKTIQASIKNYEDKRIFDTLLEESHKWMIEVKIDEKTSNEAEVVAEEIKKCMGRADSKNYDWSIGYYIDLKTDKDNKVSGKDIYVMLARKDKTKK